MRAVDAIARRIADDNRALCCGVSDLLERKIHPRGSHVRATASLVTRRLGDGTDDGHGDSVANRQSVVLVAQQDDALLRQLAGQQMVCIEIDTHRDRGASYPIAQRAKAIHTHVDFRLGDPSRCDRGGHLFVAFCVTSGHLQIKPRLESRDPVIYGAPVRHNHALETPLLTQDFREKPRVLGRGNAVDLVVGGHDRRRTCLRNDPFECWEVNLAQGPLVDIRTDGLPVSLLIVGSEMLDGNSRALRLQRARERHAQYTRQVRVL